MVRIHIMILPDLSSDTRYAHSQSHANTNPASGGQMHSRVIIFAGDVFGSHVTGFIMNTAVIHKGPGRAVRLVRCAAAGAYTLPCAHPSIYQHRPLPMYPASAPDASTLTTRNGGAILLQACADNPQAASRAMRAG